MCKLTYAKSKLKVLITYNWDIEKNKDYEYVFKILKKNFSEIISQSNQQFSENETTEYILIVGQKRNENLIWKIFVFNYRGEEKIF